MLCSEEDIRGPFKQSFVFFQPRDMVSGDFFWYISVELPNDPSPKKILAMADRTGHGIPGAFMTMLGSTLLHEIVNEKNIIKPDQILHYLDRMVIASLQKKGKQSTINDGMDIGILIIDEVNGEACFADAKTPFWYINNQQLLEIKGSKFPVGSTQYKKPKEVKVLLF